MRVPSVCRKDGIVDLRFHDLRHEAGSRFLEAGWPLHEVQYMLGHADIKNGARISFVMGPKPNRTWGSAPADMAPSMSDAAGQGEIRWRAPVDLGWAIIADFDGDGQGEIACAGQGEIYLLKGDGGG